MLIAWPDSLHVVRVPPALLLVVVYMIQDYASLMGLSDHPKPANEYHLKTGQREQRLGH